MPPTAAARATRCRTASERMAALHPSSLSRTLANAEEKGSPVSITRLLRLNGVSRATFGRSLERPLAAASSSPRYSGMTGTAGVSDATAAASCGRCSRPVSYRRNSVSPAKRNNTSSLVPATLAERKRQATRTRTGRSPPPPRPRRAAAPRSASSRGAGRGRAPAGVGAAQVRADDGGVEHAGAVAGCLGGRGEVAVRRAGGQRRRHRFGLLGPRRRASTGPGGSCGRADGAAPFGRAQERAGHAGRGELGFPVLPRRDRPAPGSPGCPAVGPPPPPASHVQHAPDPYGVPAAARGTA